MPKVSIVICAYNAADTIAQSLESAMLQSYHDIEIIVVNDASTDETRRIIEAYAASDCRIKIVDNPQNMQLLESRRIGFLASAAPFVLYLDADDLLLPRAVEILIGLIDSAGGKLSIAHASSTFTPKGGLSRDQYADMEQYLKAHDGILEGDEIVHVTFRDHKVPWHAWGKLYDRRVLEATFAEIPSTRVFQFEDGLIYFIASHFAERYIGNSAERIVNYQVGSGESMRHEAAIRFGLAFSLIRDFIKRHGFELRYFDDLAATRRMLFRDTLPMLFDQESIEDRRKGYDELSKYFSQNEVNVALGAVLGMRDWEDRLGFLGVDQSHQISVLMNEISNCNDDERLPSLIADLARVSKNYEGAYHVLQRCGAILKTGNDLSGGKAFSIESPIDWQDGFALLEHLEELRLLIMSENASACAYRITPGCQTVWDLILCKKLGAAFTLALDSVIESLGQAEQRWAALALLPRLISLCDTVECSTKEDEALYSALKNQPVAENTLWDAMSESLLSAQTAITQANEHNAELETALASIRHQYESSNSWRVGRAITALPRLFRR